MLLFVLFYMYIVRILTNCHIHDVHMRIVLEPHSKFQFDFCVIMGCFAC